MTTYNNVAKARAEGMLFGIPLGELGLVQTLLMSFASGFAAFFGATFVAIVALLAMLVAGRHVDFALTYKRAGLPVGLVVLVVALSYLGSLWVKRKLRGSRNA